LTSTSYTPKPARSTYVEHHNLMHVFLSSSSPVFLTCSLLGVLGTSKKARGKQRQAEARALSSAGSPRSFSPSRLRKKFSLSTPTRRKHPRPHPQTQSWIGFVACREDGINAIAASKQSLAMDAAAGLESLSVDDQYSFGTVLKPVLARLPCYSAAVCNATSADLVAAALDLEPKLAAGSYQNQICGALVDDAGNAPYLAAAEAIAAGNTEQLQALTTKQLALRLLLERMETSVELANDQTLASLAVMLPSDYRDCIMVGFRFQPSFTTEQSKAMEFRINESFRDIDPLPGLPQIAVAALAGQEFLNACLSIDPSTGEVEPEGLCNAAKRSGMYYKKYNINIK